MRLKKHYSARDVAGLTGLTARQLQWWDARGLARASIASRRTVAGGFTERYYSPIDLYELLVMADLRRRGFSVARILALVGTLRDRFGIRLFDAIEGGPLTLLTDGRDVYLRTADGAVHGLLRAQEQPRLALGGEEELRELRVRIRRRRAATRRKRQASA